MKQDSVPVAEGVFTWPADEPRLIGSRCLECGVVTFPVQSSCPRCTSEEVSEELLERRGRLWTWTTQGFPPKSPPYAIDTDAATFEPYAVGYVELPGQVLVETRLAGVDPSASVGAITIGMEMELTIEPFHHDEEGNEVVMFAFRPAPPDESQE